MKVVDLGSYYFIANPIQVGSAQDACDALRDCLAGEDIHPSDVEEIIHKFRSRIREVKAHG